MLPTSEGRPNVGTADPNGPWSYLKLTSRQNASISVATFRSSWYSSQWSLSFNCNLVEFEMSLFIDELFHRTLEEVLRVWHQIE